MPIIYEVDRIRDGTSFTTRRVIAIQHGQRDLHPWRCRSTATSQALAISARCRTCPSPSELPSETEIKERMLPLMPDPVRRYYERERPIELRPVEYDRYLGKKIEGGRFHVWIRATGRLPDEPAIHQCVLAYASDMMLLDSALIPHGRTVFERDIMAASLDHALWFHRPFRADEWLLYAQDSPNLARLARLLARLDLRQRRHAGGLGGAGRTAAAAPARSRTRRQARTSGPRGTSAN